jgi:hypothetical protein
MLPKKVSNMTEEIENSGILPPITIDGLTPSINIQNQVNDKNEEKISTKRKVVLLVNDDITNAVNRGLYESIIYQGEPYFLRCYNAKRGNAEIKLFSLQRIVTLKDELLNGDLKKTKYKPKESTLEALPFECLNTIGEVSSTIPDRQELFDRVLSTIQSFVDIPIEWYRVCTLVVLLSYEQHKFNWLPYLGIFGDTGSGKSILAEVLSYLCYRGAYFIQVNSANVYHFLKEYEETVPTFAEDETQGFEKDTEKSKIYKAGNSKNGKVPRVLTTPTGSKLLVYPTYCLKILAGEQVPIVKGLNERLLTINMSKGKASKDWYARGIDEMTHLKELKMDLLKWHMVNYSNQYSDDIKATCRIENNLRPLRTIAKGLSVEKEFDCWCREAIQRNQNEKKSTLEGFVVEAVYDLVINGDYELEKVMQGQAVTKIYISFDDLWARLKIITFATTDGLNEKLITNEFGEVSKNKIGRILTDIFGSKTISRTPSGSSGIKVRFRVFNAETLGRVVSNYFDEEETERFKQRIQQSNKETNNA